jgi:hypothetical protein
MYFRLCLQHHGQFEYERVREGVLTDTALVRVPAGCERSRVTFALDDAASLSAATLALTQCRGGWDLVLVDGILARQTQPLGLLRSLPGYVRPGGVLVIASANDWDPSVTPRNSWLGGFKMNGEEMATLGMLK